MSCHLIENLGGPDAGNVGRRTDPQDFLLDLCQFLPAAFDRQVSPRNHHAQGPGIAHRREQQPGKVEKCSSCFDLQHHGKILSSMALQFLLQDFDIRRKGDEGIAHNVGMGCRKGQIGQIPAREGGDRQSAVWEVDPLLGA